MSVYSVKCGMCGALQTEEDPTKLSGTTITMNGVARHACGGCMEILRTAFSVGKEGMQDPIKALAAVTAERDALTRRVQSLQQVSAGDLVSLEEMAAQRKTLMLENPRFVPSRPGMQQVLRGPTVPAFTPALPAPAPEPEAPETPEEPKDQHHEKSGKPNGKKPKKGK